MSEKPKITYVSGRGYAELSRLIFAVNEVETNEDNVTTKAEFENLKSTGKMVFHQLPLLEIDGLCLVESSAQGNYLGFKYDMLGGTDNERGRVQMFFVGARSCWIACGCNWAFVDDPERKEETFKAAISSAKNRYLPAFEKALAENGTGFLVGSSATIADCALYDIMSYFDEMPEYGDLLAEWPQCKAFLLKFAEIPGVKKYLNSPRRFPPPDSAYVAEVKAAASLKF